VLVAAGWVGLLEQVGGVKKEEARWSAQFNFHLQSTRLDFR
jgi:hypothetical protein